MLGGVIDSRNEGLAALVAGDWKVNVGTGGFLGRHADIGPLTGAIFALLARSFQCAISASRPSTSPTHRGSS